MILSHLICMELETWLLKLNRWKCRDNIYSWRDKISTPAEIRLVVFVRSIHFHTYIIVIMISNQFMTDYNCWWQSEQLHLLNNKINKCVIQSHLLPGPKLVNYNTQSNWLIIKKKLLYYEYQSNGIWGTTQETRKKKICKVNFEIGLTGNRTFSYSAHIV